MKNLLLTQLDWDTDNLTLARCLPGKVLILNVPNAWDAEEIDALLEKRIGLLPRGYEADDAEKFLAKAGRLDCVTIDANATEELLKDGYSPVVIMYRAMQVLALTKETRQYLDDHDPKALEQLLEAITVAETLPEIYAYQAKNGSRAPLPDWAKQPPRTASGRAGRSGM
jgi:hypothetical protein